MTEENILKAKQEILKENVKQIIKMVEQEKNKYNLLTDDLEKIQAKEKERNLLMQNNFYQFAMSTLSEALLIIKSQELWGENSEAFFSSKYDDYLNGVDVVLYLSQTDQNESILNQENKNDVTQSNLDLESQVKQINQRLIGLGVDVTFSGRVLENKLLYLKQHLEKLSFGTLKYLPNGQIKEIEIPHFIIYLPIKELEKITIALNKLNFRNESLKHIKIKAEEELGLNIIPYAIYQQIFIQVKEWEKQIRDKKDLINSQIKNLKEQLDYQSQKTTKNKITGVIIDKENQLLNLEIMDNTLKFIHNYFKNKIDSELLDLAPEEKNEMAGEIAKINYDFGCGFLSQIVKNQVSAKNLICPISVDLKKEEVMNFLKDQTYL